MTGARAGVLVLLFSVCVDPEPAEAPAPKPPPDPLAAELVESLLRPGGPPSPEDVARACADPARACDLYRALRQGRAAVELDR